MRGGWRLGKIQFVALRDDTEDPRVRCYLFPVVIEGEEVSAREWRVKGSV